MDSHLAAGVKTKKGTYELLTFMFFFHVFTNLILLSRQDFITQWHTALRRL